MHDFVCLVWNALRRSGTRLRLPCASAVLIYASALCSAHAQVNETTLHAFQGGADGWGPWDTLLADTTGPGGSLVALYGTTQFGGTNGGCYGGNGCGTAFQLTPPNPPQVGGTWTNTVLWSFSGGADGGNPEAGLFSPTAGVSPATGLYGTTAAGTGTVFSLNGNDLTTLWTFTGGPDGSSPFTNGVIADTTGTLYGSTKAGGSGGCGTIYTLTPPGNDQTPWNETTLYAFTGGQDGCHPNGLIADPSSGVLYGSTYSGAIPNCNGGCGTVFALIPPGQGQTAWTEQTLWRFGNVDGANPTSTLTEDQSGALYGATYGGNSGNCYNGCGTVFKLVASGNGRTGWTKHTLWNFSGGSDGAYPLESGGALLIDQNGALYGTTQEGGSSLSLNAACLANGCGTVFKLTPGAAQAPWTKTTLWTFSGSSDGGSPHGGLTADNGGALYGTTALGGVLPIFGSPSCGSVNGCGVVYMLTGTGYAPSQPGAPVVRAGNR